MTTINSSTDSRFVEFLKRLPITGISPSNESLETEFSVRVFLRPLMTMVSPSLTRTVVSVERSVVVGRSEPSSAAPNSLIFFIIIFLVQKKINLFLVYLPEFSAFPSKLNGVINWLLYFLPMLMLWLGIEYSQRNIKDSKEKLRIKRVGTISIIISLVCLWVIANFKMLIATYIGHYLGIVCFIALFAATVGVVLGIIVLPRKKELANLVGFILNILNVLTICSIVLTSLRNG